MLIGFIFFSVLPLSRTPYVKGMTLISRPVLTLDLASRVRATWYVPTDAEMSCVVLSYVEMDRAECQSTGNRRILQCRGLATWQACGKIVSVERADYYEFMVCALDWSNAKFSLAHLSVLGMQFSIRCRWRCHSILANATTRGAPLSEHCGTDTFCTEACIHTRTMACLKPANEHSVRLSLHHISLFLQVLLHVIYSQVLTLSGEPDLSAALRWQCQPQ